MLVVYLLLTIIILLCLPVPKNFKLIIGVVAAVYFVFLLLQTTGALTIP